MTTTTPTSRTVDRAWLHEFARLVRLTTLMSLERRNTCIVSTRLGLRVLDKAGVPARAQGVWPMVFNEKAYALRKRGVPLSQWPDEAWSVGINELGSPGEGWSGHLALVVRQPSQPRVLIDLSADQFRRPSKDIYVEGPVFMDIKGPWTPEDPLYVIANGDATNRTIIEYRPMQPQHPMAKTYLQAPDWIEGEEAIDQAADDILAVLDK